MSNLFVFFTLSITYTVRIPKPLSLMIYMFYFFSLPENSRPVGLPGVGPLHQRGRHGDAQIETAAA